MTEMADEVFALGIGRKFVPTSEHAITLSQHFGFAVTKCFLGYSRAMIRDQVIHSITYTRCTKWLNYVVSFCNEREHTGMVHFGEVGDFKITRRDFNFRKFSKSKTMLICIIGRAELFIAITQVLAQKSGVNEYFVTEYSFSFIYMEKCTTQCTSVNQLHVVCHASMTTPPTAPCTGGNCAVQNNRNTWIRYFSSRVLSDISYTHSSSDWTPSRDDCFQQESLTLLIFFFFNLRLLPSFTSKECCVEVMLQSGGLCCWDSSNQVVAYTLKLLPYPNKNVLALSQLLSCHKHLLCAVTGVLTCSDKTFI